ncbi:MAG: hypothetical protein IKX40_01740 [Thermoguttaceae bacterium]|nr:hypothetical protein [Thermoguttaceae bacterium]
MSFFYIRPYFSVASSNNNCPISIYSRFLIALFVLGIGLTASVLIKEFSQNYAAPSPLSFDEAAAPVKGTLESFPRDFTLNPSTFGRYPSRNNGQKSGPVRYSVSMTPAEKPDAMERDYPGTSTISCNIPETPTLSGDDVKPSLPVNPDNISEEEFLKLGYRRHITVNGDCLKKLAEQYLHDANRWEEIYKLNKDSLANQNVVPIGIVLIIPAK